MERNETIVKGSDRRRHHHGKATDTAAGLIAPGPRNNVAHQVGGQHVREGGTSQGKQDIGQTQSQKQLVEGAILVRLLVVVLFQYRNNNEGGSHNGQHAGHGHANLDGQSCAL